MRDVVGEELRYATWFTPSRGRPELRNVESVSSSLESVGVMDLPVRPSEALATAAGLLPGPANSISLWQGREGQVIYDVTARGHDVQIDARTGAVVQ